MIVGNTIEQALEADQAIIGFGTQTSAEEYSYCPKCGKLRWLGSCVECDFSNEQPAQEASGAGR